MIPSSVTFFCSLLFRDTRYQCFLLDMIRHMFYHACYSSKAFIAFLNMTEAHTYIQLLYIIICVCVCVNLKLINVLKLVKTC